MSQLGIQLTLCSPESGMSLTNLSLAENILITVFPARDSLVRDIPSGDGKIANLFYSVEQTQPLFESIWPVVNHFLPFCFDCWERISAVEEG
jgi:hypothetical protein